MGTCKRYRASNTGLRLNLDGHVSLVTLVVAGIRPVNTLWLYLTLKSRNAQLNPRDKSEFPDGSKGTLMDFNERILS